MIVLLSKMPTGLLGSVTRPSVFFSIVGQ